MKIKLNENALRQKMEEKGIKNYKQLAAESGVSENSLYSGRHRHGTYNKEILWLLSECLECSINDLVYAEWDDGA